MVDAQTGIAGIGVRQFRRDTQLDAVSGLATKTSGIEAYISFPKPT
jgi:hypothetical protein